MSKMSNRKKLLVSYAPFWHDGSGITQRSYNTILAAMAALLPGIFQYGMPALGVVCLSISSAMLWEFLFNIAAKRPVTIGDGNAALIGTIFAMLVPATVPWWLVITGTFLAVIIGKQIFGGIGGNAFNPVALAIAMLVVSWKGFLDFDMSLLNYDLGFSSMVYPLGAVKAFGSEAVENIRLLDLLVGKQIGAIGSTCGIGLILGGLYLMARGFIRWEISISFLAGVFICALIFNITDPARFAGPGLHLLSGYTLVGAFFLATEDSSSPVNFIPMIIYGLVGGTMTVIIRNIGLYIDGVILAVLLMNLINPLVDKIRPKAIGV